MQIFYGILRSQIQWSGVRPRKPRSWGRDYHKAVGKLLAYEREPKNTVGTYCGSKDWQFMQTMKLFLQQKCPFLAGA